MMNWIWLGFILVSIIVAGFSGKMDEVTKQTFASAEAAAWFALKLVGIMAFWLGIMRVAQDGGLMRIIARWLRRPMRFLFPDVPEDHPAMSAMIMNFSANMLGLGNAATPFGIKAMMELNKLNQHKGTATNAMCLFLAINTSALSLFPLGVMTFRSGADSEDPASIWLPTILATAASTFVAIVAAKLLVRMRRFQLPDVPEKSTDSDETETQNNDGEVGESSDGPEPVNGGQKAGWAVRAFVWLVVIAFLSAAVYHYGFVVEGMGVGECVRDFFSSWAIPALMGGLLLFGLSRKVRVYESLVEGAKEGFKVAVTIIPYLVAIFVAVGMFNASGAMDLLKETAGQVTGFLGMPVEALPMAILRPLSGSGATGYMNSVLISHGPDSFVGQMVSVMQGSTETTLYVLAVYFGAVQIYRVRYALAAGLIADLGGIIAAVGFTHLFFLDLP